MNIKRKIGLFFINYGKFLFAIIAIVGGIILLTQGLNNYYKNKEQPKNEEEIIAVSSNIQVINKSEDKENQELIKKFAEFCNNGQVEKAYEMISSNCKIEKYPTLESFRNNYYNKMFKVKQEIEIKLQNDASYEIEYSDDSLLTGKNGTNKKIDYYRIINEPDSKKITINISKQ